MPNKPKSNYSPEVGLKGKDLFQTPDYALDLLYPYIPRDIDTVWEPAAGEGKIVRWLKMNNYIVISTDINGKWALLNFLCEGTPMVLGEGDAIITNPPFSLKKKFFYKCLEYNVPFALLIPADFSLWNIDAVRKYGCKKLIPTRRIDYITPTGKKSSAQFHSMWLCSKEFTLPDIETFVELTKQMKENI